MLRQSEPLKAQLKGTSSNVIFLYETKAFTSRMEYVMNTINFSNMYTVEAKGTAGGICVFWKVGFSFQQVKFDRPQTR